VNTAAVLALVGDLYAQIAALTEENRQLREALEQAGTKGATA
jgi:N-methylhydantoinase B/oxoprolinase/acetone carboxylase alpha subunit